jgi:hypothetical protein
MKSALITITLLSFVIFQSVANTHPALEKDNQTLKERYLVLKSKSETFNEYKVIKESLLDDFWKLTMDSIQSVKSSLETTIQKVDEQQNQINSLSQTLVSKEEAVAGILHESTHINFLGIDFSKSFFSSFFISIVLIFLTLAGLFFWRFKVVHNSASENKQLFDQLHSEFESYKQNALDKQMKLSRELQTERNRLQEILHTN